MSTLPRSTGSFKKLRVVRLVSRLFRRRRRKTTKESGTPALTISSPTPILTNFSTMSLIIHCRHLSRSTDLESSYGPGSPLSSSELIFNGPAFSEDDDEDSHYENPDDLDFVCARSISHETIFQLDNFCPRKMIRSRSGSKANAGTSGNGGGTSSLLDISNAALRSELESKVFIRAKRINSGTDDPSVPVRSKADSASSHQHARGSTVESSSSLMSYRSSSDVDLDRHKLGLESLHSSPFNVMDTRLTSQTTANNIVMYRRKTSLENMLQTETMSPLPSQPTDQMLSHDAARHRIAVKPRNRRPKSSYQRPSESTWTKIPSWKTETSFPTFDVPDINMDYDNASLRTRTLSEDLATVLSEVQATYELLQTVPGTHQTTTVPSPVVRKTSVGYSKSFQIPRRPSAEPLPTKAPISPQLSSERTARETPPVFSQTFKSINDDFKKVLPKYQKTIEPSVISEHKEQSSSSTSALPHASLAGLHKPFSQPDQTSSSIMITTTDAFKAQVLFPLPATPSSVGFQPIEKSFDTPMLSDGERSVGDSFSTGRLPYSDPKLEPSIMEITSQTSLPRTNNGMDSGNNSRKDDIVSGSKIVTFFPAMETSVAKPDIPIRNFNAPLISPKPRLRQTLNSTASSVAEQELLKVLAKRSANLQDENERKENSVLSTENMANTSPARRSYSFKENLTPNSAAAKKEADTQRSVFADLGSSQRANIIQEKSLSDDKSSSRSVTMMLKKNFFNDKENTTDTKMRTDLSDQRKVTFRQHDSSERAIHPVPEFEFATLRKVPVPDRAESIRKPTVPDFTSLLRKYSSDSQSMDKIPKPVPSIDFVSSLRKSSLKTAEPAEELKEQKASNLLSSRKSSLRSIEFENHESKGSSQINSSLSKRKVLVEGDTAGKTVDSVDSRPSREGFAISGLQATVEITQLANLAKGPVQDEATDVGGSVFSRAAIFQQKVDCSKPLSPRCDTVKASPVPPVRTLPRFRPLAQPPESSLLPPRDFGSVSLKSAISSHPQLPATAWTPASPIVPLKPVNSSKVTKAASVSQPSSCGSVAGASDVPQWVILAQEKRKRISMLSDASDFGGKQNQNNLTSDLHVVDASYA